MNSGQPLWIPDPRRRDSSAMSELYRSVQQGGAGLPPIDAPEAYPELHRWSVEHPAEFWYSIWRSAGVVGSIGSAPFLLHGERMAPSRTGGATWFPDSRLNFAANLLRRDDTGPAIVAWDERGFTGEITWGRLRHDVAVLAAGLRTLGVGPGDRVGGWLPNIPAAVVAMLATASLGAAWTSCSPDFGVDGIVDRFGQTEPAVLIFADGYRYGGKDHDCTARLAAVLDRIPSIRT
ncbi:MAG TPA: AMP-binding protein, partial [Gemmatimonadales bacterium]|nr:AMP-binding protein [Gemmatimonadales bacterium]